MSPRQRRIENTGGLAGEPVMLVRKVLYTACLVVPLFFWRYTRSSFLVPKAILSMELAVISAAIWLVLWAIGYVRFPRLSIGAPLLLLWAAFLVSMPGCLSLPDALDAFSRVAAYSCLLFLAASSIRNGGQVGMVYGILTLAGALAGCLGILEYHDIRLWEWSESAGRLGIISTFGNPNYLAGFLVAVIPLSLGIVFREFNRPLFWPALAGCLIMMVTVVTTQTRGSWIALAIAIPAFLLLLSQSIFSRWVKRHLLPLSLAMLAGFILLTVVVVGFGPGELGTARLLSAHNVVQRLLVWRVAINMGLDHLFTGVGLGNFKVHYMDYQADFLEDPANEVFIPYNGKAVQAHNDYLQLFAETGLIGLLALGWLLFSFIMLFRLLLRGTSPAGRDQVHLVGAAASLIGVAAHGVVSFPLHLPATSLVVCIVAGIGAGFGARTIPGASADGTKASKSDRKDLTGVPDAVAFLAVLLVCGGTIAGIWKINQTMMAHTYWKRGLDTLMQGNLPRRARFEKAAALCAKALELTPANGALRANYADFLARSVEGKPPEQADPVLKRALAEYAIAKKNFMKRELYNDVGNVHMRLGQREEALECYLEGVRIDPTYYLVKQNLGNYYLQENNLEEAEKWFTQSLALYEKQPVTWLNAGLLRQQAGDLTAAAEAYRNSARYAPDNPKPFYFLAQTEEGLGNYAAAAENYREALLLSERRLETAGYDVSNDPLMGNIAHRLGVALGRSNRLDASIEALKAARNIHPESESILCDLGVALGQKGAMTEAVAAFEHGLETNPASPSLLLNLAIAYRRLLRFEKAETVLHKLIETNPGAPQAATAEQILDEIEYTLKYKKKVIRIDE